MLVTCCKVNTCVGEAELSLWNLQDGVEQSEILIRMQQPSFFMLVGKLISIFLSGQK